MNGRARRHVLPQFALVVRYQFCIFFVTRFSGRDLTGKIIQFLVFSIEMDHKLVPSLWSLHQAGNRKTTVFLWVWQSMAPAPNPTTAWF